MPLTDNLISYYKFDADNSNDSADSNNGTDTAITYSAGNGKIGHGAGFDGITSFITLGQPANLNFGTGPFSFAFWFKGTVNSALGEGLLTTRSGGDSGYQVLELSAKLYFDGVGTAGLSSSTSINTGNWVHCAVVGDRANSLLRLYVNGSADGTTALGATNMNVARDHQIGKPQQAGEILFTGALDEIGYWSRVLTAAEVSQLYNNGNGLQYPFPLTGMSHLNLMGVS